jgi:hypothetical protein
MSFERPNFLGHPNTGHTGTNGSVGKADFLLYGLGAMNERGSGESDDATDETEKNLAPISNGIHIVTLKQR